MDSKSDPPSVLPPPTPVTALVNPRPTRRRIRLLKSFAYLSLISLGCTAGTIFLAPWVLETRRNAVHVSQQVLEVDPATEWHDNIWPLRPQTPWDISTDYPYPRKLEYDVTEGTWLRLDVHPKTGDIVFDMVGDLYCIPGVDISSTTVSRARPVLLGTPYDSDPHFSPEGDRIVFRSDAGLGVENIWVMEWKGCAQMDVRMGDNEELSDALRMKISDEQLLSSGIKETAERKTRRLLREGRLAAQRVTNETYRWVSDARFHLSGTKVVATKWYTSARSLGAGEGWEYPVPSIQDFRTGNQKEIEGGSGSRILSRTLPLGWTSETYGDQQIGPEQIIWNGNNSLVFAKNVVDSSQFEYSKDVHAGIYAIFLRNLTTNTTESIVSSSPGGASRPELSRDGRTLAFVRRVRDKEALVLKDLETGSIHNAWYGLTYDLSGVSAPMGTYPSFAFSPSDDAIIVWAAGQIYSVPLAVNAQGEKIASQSPPYPIRFTAHVEKQLAETLRGGATDLVKLETQETQRVRSFQGLRVDDRGERALFEAAGVIYMHDVYEKDTVKVPVLCPSAPYYSPSFVYGADNLVLHARWSDVNFTAFELADLSTGAAYELEGLPLGRYFSPILCECSGPARQIAFVKSAGDYMSGDIIATAKPGLYIGSVTLPGPDTAMFAQLTSIPIRDITFIKSEISHNERLTMRFLEANKKLLVQQSSRSFIIDLAAGPDEHGNYPHQTLAEGEMSSELVTSLRTGNGGAYVPDNVAFVDFFHVYLVPGSSVRDGEAVWSRPANATKRLARLSLDGGHDLAWSRDGKKLFWFLGPYLHSLEVFKLKRCSSAIKHDRVNFGISCVKDLLYYQELVVEHSTDIARLKKEATSVGEEDNSNADALFIFNATLLTMATGKQETDLVQEGALLVRGGVIESVGALGTLSPPPGSTVIDAAGGFVVPGFVDVHAHWDGFATRYPAKSWEMQTFLAYGVTTVHNPSADTVGSFVERSRLESGFMVGPRIFSVGDIIYGAGIPGLHQDIVDQAEAQSALVRIKAEGGPAAISYKNYNIPSRASRQRLLIAARNLTMLCVPEGGMNHDWDLTYIIDGMTTVEHALPVPTLYDDVLTLFAMSGTGSTPTHIVNYGGAWGEQFVWANEDIPNDPKPRRFTRHDVLEKLSESTARPKNSYAFFNTSASVAEMVHRGLLANIGAHGEPPLGLNYHAEMEFTRAGGLTRYETLRAATIDGAKSLGLHGSIGSLEPGKLADFLVYPPGVDLLEPAEDRVRDSSSGGLKPNLEFSTVGPTREILLVARGGRVWDASSMEEVWPVKGRRQVMPVLNAD